MKSKLLSQMGILHGFGNKVEPVPLDLTVAWQAQKAKFKMVHGNTILHVTSSGETLGEGDGVFTTGSFPIGINTADCVPVLLAKKDGSAVAALHAGWKGTLAKIVDSFAKFLYLNGFSSAPNLQGWVAAIGPSIGVCCYKVGMDRLQLFQAAFPEFDFSKMQNPVPVLDLPLLNAHELERLKIDDLEMCDECTHCTVDGNTSLYHSFRRDGSSSRQFSVISCGIGHSERKMRV